MDEKEKSRWELGCFDSFESNFLKELHRIRKKQAEETKGKSSKKIVEYIHNQAKKVIKNESN